MIKDVLIKRDISEKELLLSTHYFYDYIGRCSESAMERNTDVLYGKARATLLGIDELSDCRLTESGDFLTTYGIPTRALYFR